MKYLIQLAHALKSEYQLIRSIWSGNYPETDMYELSLLEKSIMSILVFIRSFSIGNLKALLPSKKVRSQASEIYVLVWFFVLLILLVFPSDANWFPFVIVYRLFDSLNYRLCIVFVDRYRTGWGLRSMNRTFMLLLINYLEMIIGFAALYIYTGSIATEEIYKITSSWDALYFSVVTISTLGYGDFYPNCEMGQFLIVAQTLMGIVFILLVFSTVLTGISGIKNLKDGE